MNYRVRQKGSLAFIALLFIAGLLIALGWWMRSPNFPLRTNEQNEDIAEEQRITEGVQYRVEITNKGFVPGVLTIEPYDTVTFINRDVTPHFPAAGDLDGERICPEFGDGRQLSPTEGYAIVFKEEGECAFHDQLNENFSAGTIFIQKN